MEERKNGGVEAGGERIHSPVRPHIHSSSLRDWLQLFRIPNLVTVPGDPIAGAMLATVGEGVILERAVLVIMASVCFYGAGLLMNDIVDVEVDRKERPGRPIPSGAVSRSQATFLAFVLAVLALLFCAVAGKAVVAVGAVLLAAIMLYNALSKDVPVLGALNMGACRALNVLLGAALASDHIRTALVLVPAGITLAYIASVTVLARREASDDPSPTLLWTPAAVLALGMLVFACIAPLPGFNTMHVLTAFIVLTCARGFVSTIRPRRGRGYRRAGAATMPLVIGSLVSNVNFAQAAFVVGSGGGMDGLIVASVLLALWVVNRLLASKFYAS